MAFPLWLSTDCQSHCCFLFSYSSRGDLCTRPLNSPIHDFYNAEAPLFSLFWIVLHRPRLDSLFPLDSKVLPGLCLLSWQIYQCPWFYLPNLCILSHLLSLCLSAHNCLIASIHQLRQQHLEFHKSNGNCVLTVYELSNFSEPKALTKTHLWCLCLYLPYDLVKQ